MASEDDEVDCGRLTPDEEAWCEERERVLCLIATAARSATASPPVIAPSGCESDDCARVAREESQLSDSPVGEVVIAIAAENLMIGVTIRGRMRMLVLRYNYRFQFSAPRLGSKSSLEPWCRRLPGTDMQPRRVGGPKRGKSVARSTLFTRFTQRPSRF